MLLLKQTSLLLRLLLFQMLLVFLLLNSHKYFHNAGIVPIAEVALWTQLWSSVLHRRFEFSRALVRKVPVASPFDPKSIHHAVNNGDHGRCCSMSVQRYSSLVQMMMMQRLVGMLPA